MSGREFGQIVQDALHELRVIETTGKNIDAPDVGLKVSTVEYLRILDARDQMFISERDAKGMPTRFCGLRLLREEVAPALLQLGRTKHIDGCDCMSCRPWTT